MRTLNIDTEFIKLDSALKLADMVESGGQGKLFIREGAVLVNGETETRRGRKCYPGDRITFHGETIEIK